MIASTVSTVQDFLSYWGKTNRSGRPGNDPYHLLAWHCLDVAACALIIVKRNQFGIKDVLAACGLTGKNAENWIAWLFACHDIGKFARGFQRFATFPGSPLVPALAGVATSQRHDALGFYLWSTLTKRWREKESENEIFSDIPLAARTKLKKALDVWMSVSTGHHGIPPDTHASGGSLAFDDADITAAEHFLAALSQLFPVTLPAAWETQEGTQALREHSWFFAGVMTLADWMGSDETQFPLISAPMPIANYWSQSCEKARRAAARLPAHAAHSAWRSPQTLFPFIDTLTPLQQLATTLDISAPGPQLIIMEDVTGAGKTEAALILAQRLLSAGKGQGLYVGLPTMATANAMYQRLAGAYRALFVDDARPSLILAHGGRDMSSLFRESVWQPESETAENYSQDDASATAECHVWFTDSRKKALLADIGVGTLDQVLMSVMQFRHQSLRLLGMHNKILLLDEVHAYDGYMVRLLEGLLHFHAASGGSAIILSATLPASLREKLLAAFHQGAGFSAPLPPKEAEYPWLSHLAATGLDTPPLETQREVKRRVAVDWIYTCDDALALIWQAVEAGQCVCWIRNTVDDAIAVFLRLLKDGRLPAEDLLLFHSRFAFADRMAIEEQTLNWFGKSAPGNMRRGKVLIATQVVEQSLDLDFDVMISDLAPVDLLIQRAGRLQRHIRDACGQCKTELPDERPSPVLHILAPEWQPDAKNGWLGEALSGTGYVYPDHATLWRTQALLRSHGVIDMPGNARALIDGVYEQKITAPDTLQDITELTFDLSENSAHQPPGGVSPPKIEMSDTLQKSANAAYGKNLGKRAEAAQFLLQRNKGYCRKASKLLWEKDVEFSTRLGEKTVDVYLACQDEEMRLRPIVNDSDFGWEKSRLSVRLTWWQKHAAALNCPDEATLEQFRHRIRRPAALVIMVSAQGEAPYYSKRFGLTGNTPVAE
ncbi:CRISPR-associated helicase Cas3' [Erwinia sp. HR93]|uniref:CRISPR-associated helicase Cas3' n=1 Tax=Erwinia sp. HR93 TaxID=3094840 RepID=UPI002ADEEDD7|nr:CRISPR-associated helicase Cas3' [Erwinia sp. HR93]MEA1064177.1 CRISPR-associated helicase Cas3' [Erwinia sp. HR93]